MNNLIKTIDTLRICKACVKRQRSGECLHICSECDFSLSPQTKLDALNVAIALLDAQRNIKDVIEGRI